MGLPATRRPRTNRPPLRHPPDVRAPNVPRSCAPTPAATDESRFFLRRSPARARTGQVGRTNCPPLTHPPSVRAPHGRSGRPRHHPDGRGPPRVAARPIAPWVDGAQPDPATIAAQLAELRRVGLAAFGLGLADVAQLEIERLGGKGHPNRRRQRQHSFFNARARATWATSVPSSTRAAAELTGISIWRDGAVPCLTTGTRRRLDAALSRRATRWRAATSAADAPERTSAPNPTQSDLSVGRPPRADRSLKSGGRRAKFQAQPCGKASPSGWWRSC